jgi:hypothetical protein
MRRGTIVAGKGRSRPDRRTTCKRAAMPDRHRSRHGNALEKSLVRCAIVISFHVTAGPTSQPWNIDTADRRTPHVRPQAFRRQRTGLTGCFDRC